MDIRYTGYDDFASDWLLIIYNYNATMAKMYVNRRCELTALKEAFERCGAKCYRTRIECKCEPRKGADNRRNAVVVTYNERVILEIIRCNGCVNDHNGGQFVTTSPAAL